MNNKTYDLHIYYKTKILNMNHKIFLLNYNKICIKKVKIFKTLNIIQMKKYIKIIYLKQIKNQNKKVVNLKVNIQKYQKF